MAVGDKAIFRTLSTQYVGAAGLPDAIEWEETVHADPIYSLAGGGTEIHFSQAGHYLAMFAGILYSSVTRTENQIRTLRNGLATEDHYGRTTGYTRNSGGAATAYPNYVTIIEVASPGDYIVIEAERSDSRGGDTEIGPTTAIQLLKLDDALSYVRLYDSVGGQTHDATARSIAWPAGGQDEVDGDFVHLAGSANIQINDPGLYIVTGAVAIDTSGAVNPNARQNARTWFEIGGSKVEPSHATAYLRGSSGCNDAVANNTVLIRTTAPNQILTYRHQAEGSVGDGVVSTNQDTSITIVRLPDSTPVARLLRTTSDWPIMPSDSFEFNLDQEIGAGFSRPAADLLQIDVPTDLLVLGSFNTIRTGGSSTRVEPAWAMDRNYVFQPRGNWARYNRGQQGGQNAEEAGGGHAALFLSMTPGERISINKQDEADAGASTVFEGNHCGLQAVILTPGGTTEDRSHTTDTLIKGTEDEPHTTDVLVKGLEERSHTTDVLVGDPGGDIPHTTDVHVVPIGEIPHWTDCAIAEQFELEHTTDVMVQPDTAHTTDCYVCSDYRRHATDVFIQPTEDEIGGDELTTFWVCNCFNVDLVLEQLWNIGVFAEILWAGFYETDPEDPRLLQPNAAQVIVGYTVDPSTGQLTVPDVALPCEIRLSTAAPLSPAKLIEVEDILHAHDCNERTDNQIAEDTDGENVARLTELYSKCPAALTPAEKDEALCLLMRLALRANTDLLLI